MPETDAPIPIGDDRRQLMTLSEAADALAIDYDTMLRWVMKGVIPHVVVGPAQTKRVYRRDVASLIKPGPIAS